MPVLKSAFYIYNSGLSERHGRFYFVSFHLLDVYTRFSLFGGEMQHGEIEPARLFLHWIGID